MKKTILVTGCGGSAAYNFIDSLKLLETKYLTVGVDSNKYHLSLSNADFKYLVPSNSNPNVYINVLNKIIKKHNVDLVHPQPDPEVLFLAEHRDRLMSKIFLPSLETILVCQNKIQTNYILSNNGVNVPESYLISTRRGLEESFKKLRKKHEKIWVRAIRGAGSKAALPISELKHAEFWIDYWKKNKGIGYGDFMLSEFLPGKEFAFQSLWLNGRLITSQARQRLEYVFGNLTPSGQSSSPAAAITVSEKRVNETASSAILSIDKKATGVFCVDLKESGKGKVCVIEINAGRFFTTSNFFSHAGNNMPDHYVSLALGENLPRLKKYNSLKPHQLWLRIIDMGYKLVKDKDLGINGVYNK
jgi:carbamoyl-phosphate synthase large subunit